MKTLSAVVLKSTRWEAEKERKKIPGLWKKHTSPSGALWSSNSDTAGFNASKFSFYLFLRLQFAFNINQGLVALKNFLLALGMSSNKPQKGLCSSYWLLYVLNLEEWGASSKVFKALTKIELSSPLKISGGIVRI